MRAGKISAALLIPVILALAAQPLLLAPAAHSQEGGGRPGSAGPCPPGVLESLRARQDAITRILASYRGYVSKDLEERARAVAASDLALLQGDERLCREALHNASLVMGSLRDAVSEQAVKRAAGLEAGLVAAGSRILRSVAVLTGDPEILNESSKILSRPPASLEDVREAGKRLGDLIAGKRILEFGEALRAVITIQLPASSSDLAERARSLESTLMALKASISIMARSKENPGHVERLRSYLEHVEAVRRSIAPLAISNTASIESSIQKLVEEVQSLNKSLSSLRAKNRAEMLAIQRASEALSKAFQALLEAEKLARSGDLLGASLKISKAQGLLRIAEEAVKRVEGGR